MSSGGDVLAMALHKNLVILTSKWDIQEPGEVKNKFHPTWSGSLTDEKTPNEFITSVICLPLLAHGKSSINSAPDWTCIVVGFSTGFIRFYTETGSLLLEEQLHNESILSIKCQSQSSPKYSGDAIQTEEIHVLFNTIVCIIQGYQLFSTLRSCRNHLARVQANCWQITSEDRPPPTNIVMKKLAFKDQDFVNDCQIIGTTSVNTFDHLLTASVCGGFNASYRSSAPQHNLIMATGKRPYIAFHYSLEGGTAPALSDVAIAVAYAIGKISTSVPWFSRSKSGQINQEKLNKGLVNETAESMTCRFGLSDLMREGYSIVMSPNRKLSVITDAMGRVVLVNNRRGIAMRMWKGYRDAQCGWIQVVEEKHHIKLGKGGKNKSTFSQFTETTKSSSQGLRTALFLAIYGPKKGIIDIWGIQQGGKITTFSASKNGRLIYINYGLLGFSDIATNSGCQSNNIPQYSCVFMDPLGGFKDITVPFHFALSSKNGTRARDVHLFKKLKTFIREDEFDDDKLIEKISSICQELKTNEIRLQIIEMLMTNRHIIPDAFLIAVNTFISVLIQYEENELEPAGKTLYHIAIQLQKAIEFYKYVKTQFDKPPEYNTIASSNIPDSKYLASVLMTSETEIYRILKLSNSLYEYEASKPQPRVQFKDDKTDASLFIKFLSCFDFGVQNSIGLNRDTSNERKYEIGSLIYQGWMYSSESTNDWKEAAQQSNIKPKTMIELALIYWLNKRPGAPLEIELTRLTQLLYAICSDIEDMAFDYNKISIWWNDVRNIFMDSTKPFHALTAALACRAVGITLQMNRDYVYSENIKTDDNDNQESEKNSLANKEKQGKDSKRSTAATAVTDDLQRSSTSGWENVSKDTCQFSILIGNLEDISLLSVVLAQAPPLIDDFLSLPFEKQDISFGHIITKGKGSISESIAKWISSSGIDPARLIDTSDIEFQDNPTKSHDSSVEVNEESDKDSTSSPPPPPPRREDEEEKEEETVSTREFSIYQNESNKNSPALTEIIEKISILKRHFPYSLTSSVLLANLCWEYVVFWSKDISKLNSLEAVLGVLRQIPMKSMRQGVCCLLWNIHIKKRLESTAKLMNKTGKLPKERLCMQDVGLTDVQLINFLQCCVGFLDIFIDAEVLEGEEIRVIKSEEFWEGHGTGPQPFATLAISQTPAWYDLVMLHLQLANVLYMIANFNLKSMKFMTHLFEPVTSRYFFQDITDKIVLTWYRDDRRDNLRFEFLCRVVTASIELIQQETGEENSSISNQAIMWMSKCQTVAAMWKIDHDKLRIHQVCQLYINGFDRFAEEVITFLFLFYFLVTIFDSNIYNNDDGFIFIRF